MKTLILFLLLIFQCIFITAKVRVGIFTEIKPKKFFVKIDSGEYFLLSGKDTIVRLQADQSLTAALNEKRKIIVFVNGISKGIFSTIYLKGNDSCRNSFRISSVIPVSATAVFDDDLELSPKTWYFEPVNIVSQANYLSGVVEGEIGESRDREVLRMQSIISRTFLLSSGPEKHIKDGYNVCNTVNCQVYHGKSRFNPLIPEAVASTLNFVIADSACRPIEALFFSNCGGQTCNSESVFRNPTTYLRSVTDTFCLNSSQSKWEKRFTLYRWNTYLGKKTKLIVNDTLNFEQFARKEKHDLYNVALKDIRYDFGLKSSFFSVKHVGKEVILNGKGFGHGVGLCQQGAIGMAKYGCSALEIIRYYYSGIQIIPAIDLNLTKK